MPAPAESGESPRKDVGEGFANGALDGIDRDRMTELARHRAHDGGVEPARVDGRETRQVRRDVEREPVQRYPALDRHADRGELALAARGPDTRPVRLAQ